MKPGSPEVRKSANNIYKIPAAGGGQPAQVTKHTDGNLFWPSMSSDGKIIVYEDNFGIWKLDVASGRTSEIKLDIATDEKDNEAEIETVTNDVDNFDISPSGRRAVISARGQILTIATDRGDITRVTPDKMASRSDSPKWSADGKYVAFVSDQSGRDEVWISDPEGRTPKKITDLDNEKGALVWTPDSKLLLYTAADKKLYSYTVADAKTTVISSSDVARIGSVSVSPDSKWVAFSKQDRTLRSHVYIAPIAGGQTERHLSDDSTMYSETNAVWTADGRYIVFTSAEGASNGIASQGGLATTMELWATSLGDQDRDPMNRDIDNEAQGLAAEAAARQAAGRGGAGAPVPEVKIDWSGLARRARRLTVPGTAIGGLTAVARGALGRADRRDRRRRRRARRGRRGGSERRHVHHQRRERPAHARAAGAADRGRRRRRAWTRRRGRRIRRRRRTWCSRATAARCTSARAAASSPRRSRRTPRAGGGRRGGGGRGGRGGGAGRSGGARSAGGDQRDRAAGHLHRQHRSRSQGAARAGLQRRLAHHEEPLLRRQDARRRLERARGRPTAASSTTSSTGKSCRPS